MPKIIELSGVVGWEITAKGLKNRLPNDGGDVHLKVDSVGGSVFEANRLYNAITDYPGKITVELGAIAASAASYFPLAVGAGNITVRENTTFMGHKAWSFAIGNADEMKAEAEILDGFDKIIARVYSKVTGRTVEDTLEDMKNEFWLIGGQSVVDAGFASGIVEAGEEEDPTPEDITAKAEIVAKMAEARATLREKDNQEDLEKWAAKIDLTLNSVNVTPQGQALLFNESAPVNSGGNKDQEELMDLSEYLEKNPEAKAEFDGKVKDEAAKGTKAAVNEDRERFAKVLALSGAAIPENVLNSAKTGQTVAEFAVAEVEARNAVLTNAPQASMGGLEANDQTPAAPEGVDQDKSKNEIKLDKAIDNLVGKKKEAK